MNSTYNLKKKEKRFKAKSLSTQKNASFKSCKYLNWTSSSNSLKIGVLFLLKFHVFKHLKDEKLK